MQHPVVQYTESSKMLEPINQNTCCHILEHTNPSNTHLTLNLPTTTIVAQPFNVIKWQLKFNPVA